MAQRGGFGSSLCERSLDLFLVYPGKNDPVRIYFLATTYTTAIPAAAALYMMNRLLANIKREEVFTEKNTGYLRGMSWCCLAAGLIFLISSFYYPAFFALCAAAVFMALILRVIKNVFAQAEEIKKENDYTI